MRNKWKDVQVFNYGTPAYLLQAKRLFTGRVKFRVVRCSSPVGISSAMNITLEEIQKAIPEI